MTTKLVSLQTSTSIPTAYAVPQTVFSFMKEINQIFFTCVLCQQEKPENQRGTVVHQTNSSCTFGQNRTICQLCLTNLPKCTECNEDLVLANPSAPAQVVETVFSFEEPSTINTNETRTEEVVDFIFPKTRNAEPQKTCPTQLKQCCVTYRGWILCGCLALGMIGGVVTGSVFYLKSQSN